jgi:hypothetical protein
MSHYSVEQECNTFLKRGVVADWQSTFQSVAGLARYCPPRHRHAFETLQS